MAGSRSKKVTAIKAVTTGCAISFSVLVEARIGTAAPRLAIGRRAMPTPMENKATPKAVADSISSAGKTNSTELAKKGGQLGRTALSAKPSAKGMRKGLVAMLRPVLSKAREREAKALPPPFSLRSLSISCRANPAIEMMMISAASREKATKIPGPPSSSKAKGMPM